MKRPRRPVKRKAAKRAKIVKKPLTLDDAKPRKGFVYQWAPIPHTPTDVMIREQYFAAGWRYAKSCKGFKRHNGKIFFEGMVLLEIGEKRHTELVEAGIHRAQEQMDYANELFGLKAPREGKSFPLVPADFVVSSDYGVVPPDVDPVDVEVKVKLRLSRRFQDAAAALKMPIEQYAQVRMALYVRGDLGGLLLPEPNGTALELHESGAFNLTSRI